MLGLIAAVFARWPQTASRLRSIPTVRSGSGLGTTVLGEIPSFRRRERRLPMVKLLDERTGSPEVVSAFESLRTNLEFLISDGSVDRIVFVSHHRQTGKSTVSAGVACTLARVGRSVVAVEADLHYPTLSDQLMSPPGYGLGDIAASDSDEIVAAADARIRASMFSVPEFLSGVSRTSIATTLPGVLEKLRDRDSFVVVDSPPLRGAPETPLDHGRSAPRDPRGQQSVE